MLTGRRTVEHWESGRNNIPAGAAAELAALNDRIERGVRNVLIFTAEMKMGSHAPDVVSLTRYRTAADYAESFPEAAGLAHCHHNALTARILVALRRDGHAATVQYAPQS